VTSSGNLRQPRRDFLLALQIATVFHVRRVVLASFVDDHYLHAKVASALLKDTNHLDLREREAARCPIKAALGYFSDSSGLVNKNEKKRASLWKSRAAARV